MAFQGGIGGPNLAIFLKQMNGLKLKIIALILPLTALFVLSGCDQSNQPSAPLNHEFHHYLGTDNGNAGNPIQSLTLYTEHAPLSSEPGTVFHVGSLLRCELELANFYAELFPERFQTQIAFIAYDTQEALVEAYDVLSLSATLGDLKVETGQSFFCRASVYEGSELLETRDTTIVTMEREMLGDGSKPPVLNEVPI